MKIGDVEHQGDGNKAIFITLLKNVLTFLNLLKVLA